MDIHSTHSTRSISIWNSHLPYRFYCRGSMGATSSAHSADRFGFIMVYSLRFIAIHGPHWATSIELCAVRLLSPPRNCWSSLCLLPPVKLLQGSQLTQTRNDRLMDCAAVCVIVRFEYFEYFEYWFHHVPSVWKLFESRLKSLELGAAMRRCGLSMRLSTLDSLLLPQFVKRAKFCHDCRSWRGGRSGEAEKRRRAGEKNCKYQKHDHHVAARGGNALTSSPMFKDAQSKPC